MVSSASASCSLTAERKATPLTSAMEPRAGSWPNVCVDLERAVCFSSFLASRAAQEAWINSTANPIHPIHHVLLPKHCLSHLLLRTSQEHKTVAHLTDGETKVYRDEPTARMRTHTRIYIQSLELSILTAKPVFSNCREQMSHPRTLLVNRL